MKPTTKELSIKEKYHDALYFASSEKLNSKQPFYLTPSQYKILEKLIHYCTKHNETTFQNKDIALHVYLSETTVKDSIEALARKGYIKSESDKFNNRLGWKSKRTITINWEFIQEILNKSKLPVEDEGLTSIEIAKVATEVYKEQPKPIEEDVKLYWSINKHDYSDEIKTKVSKYLNKNNVETVQDLLKFIKDLELNEELINNSYEKEDYNNEEDEITM